MRTARAASSPRATHKPLRSPSAFSARTGASISPRRVQQVAWSATHWRQYGHFLAFRRSGFLGREKARASAATHSMSVHPRKIVRTIGPLPALCPWRRWPGSDRTRSGRLQRRFPLQRPPTSLKQEKPWISYIYLPRFLVLLGINRWQQVALRATAS